jgi:hypothetical protein
MANPEIDNRSPSRRAQDEQIAAEPKLPPTELPPDSAGAPVEDKLARHRRRNIEHPSMPPNEQFREAADYVLQKNAELYRRLI